MVTCCDYIFFMRDTYIRNITERQIVLARPERRKDKDYRH